MPAYTQVLAVLLALLALRAASEAAPTSNGPPVRCVGTKRAALCDSAGMLARREAKRLLRAAARLARLRCGSVLIVIGARQTPSDRDATDSCTLKVHGADVSIGGRALGASERAAAQRQLRARIDAEWSPTNALVDVLRTLSLPRRDESIDHGRRWLACGALVLIVVIWGGFRGCIATTYLRPHYERCRRALKRLDDVRARTKALKFTSNVCPICLDVLPTATERAATAARPLASTIYSAHPTRRHTRRARALHADDTSSEYSFDSASTSSTDDDSKRRTLPCGHGTYARPAATPPLTRRSVPRALPAALGGIARAQPRGLPRVPHARQRRVRRALAAPAALLLARRVGDAGQRQPARRAAHALRLV